MQASDRVFAVNFLLEAAAEAPVWKRVRVYRGLAEIAVDPEQKKELTTLAEVLEGADKRCQEFKFGK